LQKIIFQDLTPLSPSV